LVRDRKKDQRRRDEAPATSAATETVEFHQVFTPEEEGSSHGGPAKILLRSGAVTTDQLAQAQEVQASRPGMSTIDALVASKAVDEATAYEAVAEYFNLPFTRLTGSDCDPSLLDRVPLDFLKSKQIVTIKREGKKIVLGTSDPADMFLLEDVGRRLGVPTRVVVCPISDIRQALEDLSGNPTQKVQEIIQDIAEDAVEVHEQDDDEASDLELAAGESPVIRYVNYLISSAVREDASDIHIEPGHNRLRVRFRIDGILFDQQAPPISMHAAIISRLKIMANLDISERRLPQDGRIRATVHGRTVDLRVSTLPLTTGEKCVIRILDNRSISVGLEKLGMRTCIMEQFRDQILEPHGIVLVTGPTGSGKSTTLYSGLQQMDGDRLNISTVEDPVEYELGFANQVNVHDSIGMSFAAALRSLLRQDPDVIMVGEIRDEETSRIAIQASLTGHMVLSTLHTNDAPSSITRMINIGIEPFLISAAVNAVLAQRLVRRICEKCKEPVKDLNDRLKGFMDQTGVEYGTVYEGKGCDACRHTGYKGRTGIHELLLLDDELRDLVTGNPTLGELRRAARDHGMESLRIDGVHKVADGSTTIEEVLRVTET
jgi:type IV pilus assembly protein PilB